MQALSEKERGAFDVLMELKKSPVVPLPVPATNDQEKDAAMALLQVLIKLKFTKNVQFLKYTFYYL